MRSTRAATTVAPPARARARNAWRRSSGSTMPSSPAWATTGGGTRRPGRICRRASASTVATPGPERSANRAVAAAVDAQLTAPFHAMRPRNGGVAVTSRSTPSDRAGSS
ncbi:hypothetical protein ACVWXU_000712 [Streptomyces sp. TE33382]